MRDPASAVPSAQKAAQIFLGPDQLHAASGHAQDPIHDGLFGSHTPKNKVRRAFDVSGFGGLKGIDHESLSAIGHPEKRVSGRTRIEHVEHPLAHALVDDLRKLRRHRGEHGVDDAEIENGVLRPQDGREHRAQLGQVFGLPFAR